MSRPFQNLTGQTFGYWTVSPQYRSVPRPSGKGSPRTQWFCTCVCGKTAWVEATNLRQGISQSCGCKPKHIVAGKGSPAAIAASKANTKHGYSGNKNPLRRLYTIWAHMKRRCNIPKDSGFKYYGGRGITYTPLWETFEPFRDWSLANGYTDSLTLDRINSNGNYEPANCRFIPQKEQVRNTSRNIYLAENLTISEFCETHGVSYDLVWHTYYLKKSHLDVFNQLMQLIDHQVGV